jgi:hypothetical protein
MKTLLYVENETASGNTWFRLNKNNLLTSPRGIIRIARYDTIFWPSLNQGYYGDIYLKRFLRKWHRFYKQKRERDAAELVLREFLTEDIVKQIVNFI